KTGRARLACLAALVLLPLQAPPVPPQAPPVPLQAPPAAVPIDLTRVQQGPISVTRNEQGNAVTVAWPDDTARLWRAPFSLDPERRLVMSIGTGEQPVVRDARPFYQGEISKRRGGWYAFFDNPASHPDGTRHVQGTFKLRAVTGRSVGERVELVF